MDDEILYDEKSVYEARALRDLAATKLDSDQWHIAKLVGCPNPDGSFMVETYTTGTGVEMIRGVSRKTLGLLRALNGPHAAAIFKVLLIKKEQFAETKTPA
jgi:hypothetical protein